MARSFDDDAPHPRPLGIPRLWAARSLAEVDRYQESGADRLLAFVDDTSLFAFERVDAAQRLAEVDGYREAGVERLIAFADDATFEGADRLKRRSGWGSWKPTMKMLIKAVSYVVRRTSRL